LAGEAGDLPPVRDPSGRVGTIPGYMMPGEDTPLLGLHNYVSMLGGEGLLKAVGKRVVTVGNRKNNFCNIGKVKMSLI